MSGTSAVRRVLAHLRQNFVLQLSGILLAMSILPLLTYHMVSYRATQQSIIDTATRHSLEILGYQRDYLTLQMAQIEGLAANLGQVEEISRLLADINAASDPSGASVYDQLATKARIGYLLSNYRNLKGLVSIDLFSLNGVQFHVGDSLTVSDQRSDLRDRLMARTFKGKESVVWHGVEDNVYRHSSAPKVLAASKLVMHPDASWLKAEPVGMLLINYSTDYLYEHFSNVNLGQGAYFLVIDDKQRLIYHPDKSQISSPVASDFFQLLQGSSDSFIQRLGNTDVLLSYTQIPDK